MLKYIILQTIIGVITYHLLRLIVKKLLFSDKSVTDLNGIKMRINNIMFCFRAQFHIETCMEKMNSEIENQNRHIDFLNMRIKGKIELNESIFNELNKCRNEIEQIKSVQSKRSWNEFKSSPCQNHDKETEKTELMNYYKFVRTNGLESDAFSKIAFNKYRDENNPFKYVVYPKSNVPNKVERGYKTTIADHKFFDHCNDAWNYIQIRDVKQSVLSSMNGSTHQND